MKILLYSPNFSPELTGIGKYNGEFVEWLAAQGHEVDVVTAPPYYPEWQIKVDYSNKWFTEHPFAKVNVYRCPLYVPQKLNLIKRIAHLMSFAFSSFLPLMKRGRQKPDVLCIVQPTLFCAPLALIVAKVFNIKTVMHIQDFELDAMFGMNLVSDSWFKRIAFKVESWILSKFDLVTTISNTMKEKVIAKGVSQSKTYLFPNWSDIDFVKPQPTSKQYKESLGFESKDRLIVYSGNIGKKQGLDILLDVAKAFEERADTCFLIVGEGNYLEELKAKHKSLALNNVKFFDLRPWEEVPEFFSIIDLHLVIQSVGIADAVLPSKLTNILSAGGNAVVTANSDTELGIIEHDYPGIYKCITPECSDELISAISAFLANNESDENLFNKVARQYAESHIDKHKVLDSFIARLEQL